MRHRHGLQLLGRQSVAISMIDLMKNRWKLMKFPNKMMKKLTALPTIASNDRPLSIDRLFVAIDKYLPMKLRHCSSVGIINGRYVSSRQFNFSHSKPTYHMSAMDAS